MLTSRQKDLTNYYVASYIHTYVRIVIMINFPEWGIEIRKLRDKSMKTSKTLSSRIN